MVAIANTRKISADEMKKMQIKDNKRVKGIFRCFEPRGGSCRFSFKKYKGDPIMKFDLKDGEVYELPLMVARHLNQNCWYPRHTHVLDANGQPSVDAGRKVHRYSFESLEFQDADAEA